MEKVGNGLSLTQLFAVEFSPEIQVLKRGELSEKLKLNENSIKYNGTKPTIETREFNYGKRSFFLTPVVKPVKDSSPKKEPELKWVKDSGIDENALVFVITLLKPHLLEPQQFNERGWGPTSYAEILKCKDFRKKMKFLSSYLGSRMMVNVNNGDSTPSIVDLLSSEDKSNGFTFELPGGVVLSWNCPASGETVETLCRSREALLNEKAKKIPKMREEAVSKS